MPFTQCFQVKTGQNILQVTDNVTSTHLWGLNQTITHLKAVDFYFISSTFQLHTHRFRIYEVLIYTLLFLDNKVNKNILMTKKLGEMFITA